MESVSAFVRPCRGLKEPGQVHKCVQPSSPEGPTVASKYISNPCPVGGSQSWAPTRRRAACSLSKLLRRMPTRAQYVTRCKFKTIHRPSSLPPQSAQGYLPVPRWGVAINAVGLSKGKCKGQVRSYGCHRCSRLPGITTARAILILTCTLLQGHPICNFQSAQSDISQMM